MQRRASNGETDYIQKTYTRALLYSITPLGKAQNKIPTLASGNISSNDLYRHARVALKNIGITVDKHNNTILATQDEEVAKAVNELEQELLANYPQMAQANVPLAVEFPVSLDELRGAYVLCRMALCKNKFECDENKLLDSLEGVPLRWTDEKQDAVVDRGVNKERWGLAIKYFLASQMLRRKKFVSMSTLPTQNPQSVICCPVGSRGQRELPEERVIEMFASMYPQSVMLTIKETFRQNWEDYNKPPK